MVKQRWFWWTALPVVVGLLTWLGWAILGTSVHEPDLRSPGDGVPSEGPTTIDLEPEAHLSRVSPSRSEEPLTASTAASWMATDSDDEPESYRRALSGVRGRIVEPDGTPVAGISLELIELRIIDWLGVAGPTDRAEGSRVMPPLTASRTRTASDGTFHLGRAHHDGFHGLGVDLGGPRAAFRVLDLAE